VLSIYTTAFSNGDEAAFSSILLNDQVPFSSTGELHLDKAEPAHVRTSRYTRFKQIVFESGKHDQQQFYHVRIEQDGALAQVSPAHCIGCCPSRGVNPAGLLQITVESGAR
jgi:hypothetical protein